MSCLFIAEQATIQHCTRDHSTCSPSERSSLSFPKVRRLPLWTALKLEFDAINYYHSHDCIDCRDKLHRTPCDANQGRCVVRRFRILQMASDPRRTQMQAPRSGRGARQYRLHRQVTIPQLRRSRVSLLLQKRCEFEHRLIFLHRYGKPISVADYAAEFLAGAEKATAKKLTKAIGTQLVKMTINAPDWSVPLYSPCLLLGLTWKPLGKRCCRHAWREGCCGLTIRRSLFKTGSPSTKRTSYSYYEGSHYRLSYHMLSFVVSVTCFQTPLPLVT